MTLLIINNFFHNELIIFSSPGSSELLPSVFVRRASSVNFLHFHLLENALLDFNQTWQKSSLGVGDSNLFK